MNYSFEVDDAINHGVNEAIMLSNFKYWLRHNLANDKHIYDDNVWTFNSKKAFAELFPFWSEMQVRRVLDSLIKQNVIKTSNYNKMGCDRTLWYALVRPEMLEIIISRNRPMQKSKSTNAKVEIDQPIPDINTDINTDTSFGLFWDEYPNKVNKEQAAKSWKRLSLKNKGLAHSRLIAFVDSLEDWQKPVKLHASTYLNNKRWEDADHKDSVDQFAGYR